MGNITGRPTVAASGLNAYLASNDADEQLDLSFTDSYTAAVTASNTFTITDVSTTYNFTRNAQFILTDGGITANASILVPAVKKVFAVKNTTGFDCTVAISGQADTPDTVPDGTSAMFHSDGVNVRIAGGGGAAGSTITSIKDTVVAATTAAQTLSTDFENGDTIDGVVLATNDRILIKDQAAGAENGIYTVNASGAPTRATDFDAAAEMTNCIILVAEGTANADTIFLHTTDGAIVVDTTTLTFVEYSGGASTLEALTDVDSLSAATIGQVMYKSGASQVSWKDESPGDALPFTLSPKWRGAIATLSGDITLIDASAGYLVPWDAEIEDTDGFHTTGGSNTRMTIPAGVTKVNITYNVVTNSQDTNTVYMQTSISKNGSATFIGSGVDRFEANSPAPRNTITVLGISVVEGDYFEVRIDQAADQNFTLVSALSHFTIEVAETTDTVPSLRTVVASLPAKARYARISKSVDQTSIGTGVVECTFDQTLVDTDSLSDLSNNALVVPAGVRKVNVRAFVQMLNAGTAGSLMTRIQVNDAPVSGAEGFVRFERGIAGSDSEIQAFTGIVDVTEGDSFTLDVQMTGDATADISTATWMEMEIVEFNSSTDAVQAYIAVPPEHKGVSVDGGGSGTQSIPDASLTTVTFWDNIAQGGNTFDPGDGGPAQRFWLGVDQTFADGDVDVGNDEIDNLTAHGFQTGEGPVTLTSSGTLPAGLALARKEWIIRIDANTIAFAASRADALAGTKRTITSAASGGTHTIETAEKLVIPAGVSKARFTGQVWLNGPTSLVRAFGEWWEGVTPTFFHNQLQQQVNGTSSTNASLGAQTAVLDVTEGEFYIFRAYQDSAGANDISAAGPTLFQIEVIEESRAITYPGVTVTPPWRGARVKPTSTLTGVDATGTYFIPFDFEVEDTDGFHDTVTNNTRITIPTGSGISRVNLSFSVRIGEFTEGEYSIIQFYKNGAFWDEYGSRNTVGQLQDGTLTTYATGSVLGAPVVEGDYFEVRVLHETDTTIDLIENSTNFAIEVVETDENAFPPEPIEWFVHGAPATTDDLFMKVATRRFTVADALAGSEAYANGGANGGAVVYDVERNGTKIGDITFADTTGAAAAATFSTVAAQQYVFDVGDRLEIVSPANVQSMTDIAFSLWGWRS